MSMMPPHAADDVSPLRSEMMYVTSCRNDAMFALTCRSNTSLPKAASCAKHASFARRGKHHSKKRLLSVDKRRFFAVKVRVKGTKPKKERLKGTCQTSRRMEIYHKHVFCG